MNKCSNCEAEVNQSDKECWDCGADLGLQRKREVEKTERRYNR